MADATRFQVKSKQIVEQKQATDAIATQKEKLTQSQAQIYELIQSHQRMEAMMAALMSQRSNQLGRPPDPQYSVSGDLTSYSQAPQPPDPPDFNRSRQNPTIKAPDPPDFNQSKLISAIQIPNELSLRYSCEEIHERMTNGLCIFCEELDTPGHYNLKHKGSKICLVECVDDGLPDAELVEPAVVEIFNKSVNMIREKESNPENESMSEVSLSQSQVLFYPLEPSHRCHKIHNHYESLDVVDERMCNELVCDEDDDSIITKPAKFHETYEEPQSELVCLKLKQSHDPVENHLDNFEFALTRSSLQHTPTDQYRAPFSPYQNCNDTGHYKREFGNYSEPGIEFDRASEEVEDDELQDKQPEDEAFGVNVVLFSTLILMTCKVLELIKEKASKKRKLCKNWWFKYKLNTWLSEAFHFWKYKKQINQGQICLNGLCNELVYGIEKKKLMNVEGDIIKDQKLDHNLIALNLQICCCIGGLSASGFEMETWTVKKSLEWLSKLTIAISLAQMFLDHICKLQSTPQDMLSDRDPTFLTVRVLRADLSSDTTYEFIFGQPHPVHFPFSLE